MMTIDSLQNGQTVTLRTGRQHEDSIVWSSWREAPLHVMRDPESRVCLITPADEVFAEFDPRENRRYSKKRYGDCQYLGNGRFMAEDYVLEIAGLE